MISHELLDQLRHLLRPLSTRIHNIAARAVVHLVDDSKKMQLLQIELLKGEVRDGAEYVQPYGFSSVPLAGADTAAVIFPNGDRSHPLVVSVGDRRYRPTGGDPGEVTVYNHVGAKIVLTKDGDIEARSATGIAVELATKADVQALTDYLRKQFDSATGHTHGSTSPGNPTAGVTEAAGPGVTGTAPAPSGTSKFKAE